MKIRNWLSRKNFWLAMAIGIVLVAGLRLDLMDVDAAQYASISMEMLQNGQFLQVLHRGEDYLDKPPLLFWTAAVAFKMLGINNVAYKLPSFLALLGAFFAVYRFTASYYNTTTARHATFIFVSSLGTFLLANDVRTDTLLLGTTTCAVLFWASFIEHSRWQALLAGAVFVGLALLSKGPIGFVIPVFAIGTHLAFTRQVSKMKDARWLLALVVIAAMLLPMCWGLYHQFDLHPEKPLRDRQTSSGLYFYFWEQSFGRVTGGNVWQDDTTPLYFIHTYLWAFLPWSLIFFGALFAKIRAAYFFFLERKLPLDAPHNAASEWYSLGGFLLTFLALSASRYKLPHYIFVTLPWAAVMTAAFINHLFSAQSTTRLARFWTSIQHINILIVAGLIFLILKWIFPTDNVVIWLAYVSIFSLLLWKIFTRNPNNAAGRLVKKTVLAAIAFGVVLNFWFYPHLLPYQSTLQVGKFWHENNIPPQQRAFFMRHGHSLDFYGKALCRQVNSPAEAQQIARQEGNLWLYTHAKGKKRFDDAQIRYEIVQIIPHFQVARLHPTFLNARTRSQSLDTVFLLKL